MRVLVIDDEGTVRKSCERILDGGEHDVTCVDRGEGGLSLLGWDDFDVVVLDLMMPGIGGMETLRLIRRDHPQLPVVIITGYATPEVEAECRENGASVWLPKPFGPDELTAALAEAIAGAN